jgi:MFS family permease
MSMRAWGVLFTCFCIVLASYCIRYSYGTLLPEMLPSLSITKAQAGVIYSSFFVAYTVVSPILGLLADRFDTRIILTVFVTLMGVGAFLMQYSSSVLEAAIYFTLVGIGSAACWAPVMALAQRWISDKRRGMSLAYIDGGSSLGVMVAGAVVPLAVAGSGWQLGWKGLGIFGITLGIISFFLIRNSPRRANAPEIPQSPGKGVSETGYRQILKDRRFWLIGLAYLLTGFSILIPFTFLSTYAVQEMSFPYSSATLLITIIGIGGTIGKLILGPVSDKTGRIKIMSLCAILIAGGCLAMTYGRGWFLLSICFIFGIGYGACWSMYAACAADFFPKRAAGGIIGLWTIFLGIGSVIAPIISGWTADISGTLMWAFVTGSAGGLISLLLLIPLLKAPQYSTSKNQ